MPQGRGALARLRGAMLGPGLQGECGVARCGPRSIQESSLLVLAGRRWLWEGLGAGRREMTQGRLDFIPRVMGSVEGFLGWE